jgi:N-acetylneuraminate epimerase
VWRLSAPAPEPRAGYAAGVIEGKLVIAGGTFWEGTPGRWTKKIFSAATHAFDPVRESWEKLPDAPVTLGYAASAQVGGALYVIGGVQNGRASREVYSVRKRGSTYLWQLASPLPEPRLFASAVAIGTRIYVIGGVREFEPFDAAGTCCTSQTAANTLWVYDTEKPATGWRKLNPYPGSSRWAQQAAAGDSAIYMFGGSHQGEVSEAVQKFNEVLRYELDSGAWSRVADLPEGLQGAAPVAVSDRIILIGSGQNVAAFDPKTRSFSPLDPLPRDANVDRFFQIGTLLVGASGESSIEGPRRRSETTFVGHLTRR